MQSKRSLIDGIEVYLERRRSRPFVGLLTKDEMGFLFEYDEGYLRSRTAISMGPEMPLTRKTYRSETLFIPFEDRIPSRENPAYPEYCAATGIDVNEKNPLILLSTIGKRGPSSLIFEAHYKDSFSSEDLLLLRKELGLSVREFARCFDLSHAAVTRVEKGQSSGREMLKRVSIYAQYPDVLLGKLKRHGGIIHTDKRKKIEKFLRTLASK